MDDDDLEDRLNEHFNEVYVGDLEARLNRILLGYELEDAPEDPHPPPRTHQDQDLQRRLQILIRDNEADRRERAARRIQSRVRTRRQRKKYLNDLYKEMRED